MALVQSTKQRVGSGNNVLAFGTNPLVGSLLIAAVTMEDNTSTVTVADNQNGGWTAVAAMKEHSATNIGGQIFYKQNAAGGATTVTATPSAGSVNLAIFEYSGYLTVGALDQHIEAEGSATTAADSGNVTTTADTELLFALGISNRSLTAGAGYTLRENDTFNIFYACEEKIAGAAGVYNATETLGSSGSFLMCLATFKAAGGGGGGGAVLHGRTLLGAGA